MTRLLRPSLGAVLVAAVAGVLAVRPWQPASPMPLGPSLDGTTAARRQAYLRGVRQAAARIGSTLDRPGALAVAHAYFPWLRPGDGVAAVGEDAGVRALRDHSPLEVVPPSWPHGVLRIRTRGLTFRVRRVDAAWPARPGHGVRFDGPGHLLSPAGAWSPSRDGWVAQRVDEYRVLPRRDGRAARRAYEAAYAVSLPKAVTRIHDAGAYLELCRADGTPVLRFHAAVARDAKGAGRQGTIAVAGLAPHGWAEVSGTLRLRTRVPTAGLAWPVVVDPGWSSTGSMATPRRHDAAVLLTDGRVLVVGGEGAGGGAVVLASAEIYDPATRTWSATGSMSDARERFTATLLPSGKVLVAGGASGGPAGDLATAELYDPATGSWSGTGPLAGPRERHTATLLASGMVLVAGGAGALPNARYGVLTRAEIYDPATGTFSETGSMHAGRCFHTATLLASGKVLVAGGATASMPPSRTLASAEIYDPTAGTWSVAAPMGMARSSFAATRLPSGRVLAAGGLTGLDTAVASAEVYDPATDTWSPTGAMAATRAGFTTTLLPDGQVLAADGDAGRAAERYDPASGTWSSAGSLAEAVVDATVTLLPSGEVLVTGGTSLDNGGAPGGSEVYAPPGGAWLPAKAEASFRIGATATLLPSGEVLVAGGGTIGGFAEIYDPASDTWKKAGAMITDRQGATATLLESGKVLVAGGMGAAVGGKQLATAELYDPATNTWSATGSMSVARYAPSATLLPSGKVLVAGGWDDSHDTLPLSSAELYDPATGTWSPTGSMAVARGEQAATLLRSGRVLVTGGNAFGPTASVELYDPATGRWSTAAPMATARDGHTATLLPDGRVLVAGGATRDAYAAGAPTAEVYLPDRGTWSSVAPMPEPRGDHSATLLPSGEVLIAGGATPDSPAGALASAELFDPVTDTWSPAPPMPSARYAQQATLLPSGKVLLTSGFDSQNALASAVIYDPSGARDAWRPVVRPRTLVPGQSATLTGTGFRGLSEASGGAAAASPTDYPLVTLARVGGGARRVLPVHDFSDTAVSVDVPADLMPGPYRIWVTTNAITGGTVGLVAGAGGDAAPVADDQSISTSPGTPVDVTLSATDADGDALTYVVQTQPAHGTLSGTPPHVTYTPDARFRGADAFTFRASDGTLDSNVAHVGIAVDAPDSGPVARDGSVTTLAGTPVTVHLEASDADGDALTFTVDHLPAHGVLQGVAPALTYTPDAGFTGSDSLAFTASDGAASASANVTIEVAPRASGRRTGCGCSAASGSPASLGAVLLGALALGLPRRRRGPGRSSSGGRMTRTISRRLAAAAGVTVVLVAGGGAWTTAGHRGPPAGAASSASARSPRPLAVAHQALVRGIHRAVAEAVQAPGRRAAVDLIAAYFPSLAPTEGPAPGEARGVRAVRDRWPLEVTPPVSAAGAMRVTTRGLTFQVRRVDGRWPTAPGHGRRFDGPSHLLAPAGPYGPSGAGWVTGRVDEYRVLGAPGRPAGRDRYAAAYVVSLPRGVTRIHDAGTYLELCRPDGQPVLRFHAAVARGAGGHTRRGGLEVAGLAPGGWARVSGSVRLRTRVSITGLAAPVVVDPGWSSTGSMATPRSLQTATLLPDGKVLVAGGQDETGLLASAEVYDPATGTWSATGPMAAAREQATASLLPDGTVLVAGGADAAGHVLASAERYDPASGTWAATAPMASGRCQHTATRLLSGRVLVAGGEDANGGARATAEVYDPATGTWATTAPMGTARYGQTATLLPSGDVLVAGGRNPFVPEYLASVEIYHPATRTWAHLGAMSTPREQPTATLLPSGKVLVAGGEHGDGHGGRVFEGSAEIFDPATSTWTATGSMATGRAGATATLLPSGRVVVAGGVGRAGAGPIGVLASVEVFDPAAGTWSQAPDLGHVRTGQTATLLPSGSVLVAGGQGDASVDLASAEVYDPGARLWTRAGSAALGRVAPAVTLLSDGTILVAGGTGDRDAELYDPASGSSSATGRMVLAAGGTATRLASGKVLVVESAGGGAAELYDPASYTWSFTGPMKTPRKGFSQTVLASGKVLVAGGAGDGSAELYDPATGTWSATGAMHTPRKYFIATRLLSGKVLVAGGMDGSGAAIAAAELYDPATGSWSATGTMASKRAGATATLLGSGEVLVAGGGDGTRAHTASAELYDPASGTWSATGSMTEARDGARAAALPTGKVLVVGGSATIGSDTTAEVYDPATGAWSATGSLPGWRYDFAVVGLATGDVLAIGGSDAANHPLASVERFDPGTGIWTSAAFVDTGLVGHTATLLPTGQVLVAGGQTGVAALPRPVHLYDPASGTWTESDAYILTPRYDHTATLIPSGQVLIVGGFDGTGAVGRMDVYDGGWGYVIQPMTTARGDHTATLLGDGRVLFAGGLDGQGQALASAEILDTADGTVSATGAMATARFHHTATLLPSGKVLVVGGETKTGNGDLAYLASAELYDPVAGTWSSAGSLAQPRAFHTATLLADGEVLVVGGSNASGILGTAERYDPGTNTWSQAAPLLTPRAGHTATLLPDGRVLVAGGADGNGGTHALDSTELYEPGTGAWSPGVPLVTARYEHTATLLADGDVLVVGGYAGGRSTASAELYRDPGVHDAWRPVVSRGVLTPGRPATLEGYRFRGVSSASSGAPGASPTDFPLVMLRPLEGGVTRIVPGREMSATSVTVDVPADLPPGPCAVTVTANAISGGVVDEVKAPGNAPPVAEDLDVSTGFGQAVHFTISATDPDGDSLTYAVVTQPGHGTLSGTAPDLIYTPGAGYHGADTFTFKANDGTADSNVATVTISVTDPAPVARDAEVFTVAGTPVAFTLAATDVDGDAVTFTVARPPAHGTLKGTAPTLTYLPKRGFVGTDSLVFTASDGAGSGSGTVTLHVAASPPVGTAHAGCGCSAGSGSAGSLAPALLGLLALALRRRGPARRA